MVIITITVHFIDFIDNIYDEPSLPDPIYQEVSTKSESDIRVDMIRNLSYSSTKDSLMILKECPAYVRHQDVPN